MKRVVLLGKPNVGKSSLLNILVRRHAALVSGVRNATRDVNPQLVKSRGEAYTIIDLGGLTEEKGPFLPEVQAKIFDNLEKADLILTVFDVQDLDQEDQKVIHLLRKSNTAYIVAANKVDHDKYEDQVAEVSGFGLKDIYPISCRNKRGITAVRDAIHSKLFGEVSKWKSEEDKGESEEESEKNFSLAIVGRPNAGKSSLLNRLIGEERAIVSDVSGTTRDIVTDFFTYKGYDIHILDTAGIRRKNRKKEEVEDLSVNLALGAIRQCDLCLLMIDAEDGLTTQDKKIASVADHRGTPTLVAVNKWDLIKEKTWKDYLDFMYRDFPLLRQYPILPISCETGKNIPSLKSSLIQLHKDAHVKFSTSRINQLLERAILKHPPKGRHPLKIFYATQVETNPPKIKLFINSKAKLTQNYERYLLQTFIQDAGIQGIPLYLDFVEKEDGKDEATATKKVEKKSPVKKEAKEKVPAKKKAKKKVKVKPGYKKAMAREKTELEKKYKKRGKK